MYCNREADFVGYGVESCAILLQFPRIKYKRMDIHNEHFCSFVSGFCYRLLDYFVVDKKMRNMEMPWQLWMHLLFLLIQNRSRKRLQGNFSHHIYFFVTFCLEASSFKMVCLCLVWGYE